MITSEIRESLDFRVYIEHSKSLKFAADENAKLFFEHCALPLNSEDTRIKGLGLHRSSLLLYSVCIELILKARALYEEKENIKDNQIKTFKNFTKKWKEKNSSGHDLIDLIDHYKIELTPDEQILLDDLNKYSKWAGRFPFPQNEELIIEYENGDAGFGNLRKQYIVEIEEFINKQIDIMK